VVSDPGSMGARPAMMSGDPGSTGARPAMMIADPITSSGRPSYPMIDPSTGRGPGMIVDPLSGTGPHAAMRGNPVPQAPPPHFASGGFSSAMTAPMPQKMLDAHAATISRALAPKPAKSYAGLVVVALGLLLLVIGLALVYVLRSSSPKDTPAPQGTSAAPDLGASAAPSASVVERGRAGAVVERRRGRVGEAAQADRQEALSLSRPRLRGMRTEGSSRSGTNAVPVMRSNASM
jgi:hypothetical protein